jgi:hypothetical protein
MSIQIAVVVRPDQQLNSLVNGEETCCLQTAWS